MTGLVRDLAGDFSAPPVAIGCALPSGATPMVVFGRLVRRDAVPAALQA